MRLRWILLLAIAAPVALLLAGALVLWFMAFGGGDSPGSIENKAAKLNDEQLSGLSPVPATSLSDTEWETCKQEVPFEQRTASYARVARVQVDDADALGVIDQVEAWWQKAGYTVLGPNGSDPRVEAKPPNDSRWTVSIGVLSDGHLYLTVNGDCLPVSSNPKTGVRKH